MALKHSPPLIKWRPKKKKKTSVRTHQYFIHLLSSNGFFIQYFRSERRDAQHNRKQTNNIPCQVNKMKANASRGQTCRLVVQKATTAAAAKKTKENPGKNRRDAHEERESQAVASLLHLQFSFARYGWIAGWLIIHHAQQEYGGRA